MYISHNLFPSSGSPSPQAISGDAQQLLNSLTNPLPNPVLHPVLVLLSGLPGTGKSTFSDCLAERVQLAVLESDALRKQLMPLPRYTAKESTRLFQAIHEVILVLLEQSLPVLLDATSLAEAHRQPLYSIADQHSAKVILVRLKAPLKVARHRLESRATTTERRDHSDADWQVYQQMRSHEEPIRRNHLVVDTSQNIVPMVDVVTNEINRWILRGG